MPKHKWLWGDNVLMLTMINLKKVINFHYNAQLICLDKLLSIINLLYSDEFALQYIILNWWTLINLMKILFVMNIWRKFHRCGTISNQNNYILCSDEVSSKQWIFILMIRFHISDEFFSFFILRRIDELDEFHLIN